MTRTGQPDRESVLALAEREASPEHYREFVPIVRGPVFAVLMLGLLGVLAAPFLLVRIAIVTFERLLKWQPTPPST